MYRVEVVAVTPLQKAVRRYKAKETVRQRELARTRRCRYEQRRGYTNEDAARRMRGARLKAKVRAYMLLGGRCEAPIENLDGTSHVCGENDMRVLEIDHIHNDGKRHRGIGKHALCREVLRNPFDFQLLCANCHTRKHAKDRVW